MNISTNMTDYIPNSAKALIWQVFFASRNRGVSLEVHYPWIDDEKVLCISLSSEIDNSKCLGCLVVRKKNIFNYGDVGMVGLVCVAPSLQGQGHSKKLLSALGEYFKSSEMSSLVLWTSKNRVYTEFGFVEDETEYFYHVSKDKSFSRELNFESAEFYIEEVKTGVPAFASGIVRVWNESCEILLLNTNSGFTLASYAGVIDDVSLLLSKIMPDGWFYNAKADCPLLYMFRKKGYLVEKKMSSSRMALKKMERELVVIPEIPLLDRI